MSDQPPIIIAMTLRDRIAIAAMQGLLAGDGVFADEYYNGSALAYKWADAMLLERGKRKVETADGDSQ